MNEKWLNLVNCAVHLPPYQYSRGKHCRGNSEDERRKNSMNNRPSQFLHSLTVDDIKELERQTLLEGKVIDKETGTYHAYKQFSKPIGCCNGQEAYWLRAKLTNACNEQLIIHSHSRLQSKV